MTDNNGARIRYCVEEGCDSRTRGKIKPFRGNKGEPDIGFDVNDFLVCPWCMRELEQLESGEPDLGMVMTGHDNRKDWVKGEKWRK